MVSFVDKQTVILVGCPTLMIPLLEEGKDVILLDIDERFFGIFPSKNFRKFNLVNCYFFDGNELDKERFPSDSVVIMDPPFGVMNEICVRTMRLLAPQGRHILLKPYFEIRWLEGLLGFKMLDYRVDYESHRKMNRNKTVRIFVNTDQIIPLPSPEYKYCDICDKFVHDTQFHCAFCGACGDISGRGIIHCKKCNICHVKSHVFCSKCTVCKPVGHDCADTARCFICKKPGHKESDCKLENKKIKFN
ncbi:unnamed protein product [Oikopleura dioica]|uniref:CCHC-type domain-containing protein n=1 Tax=Oikopleura dioica TaxID=34765 RepID=E4WQH6_OIKDI|nr:unnamed protein product [Oikopleura dioica]